MTIAVLTAHVFVCASARHYSSGYEKDGDTMPLFANTNVLLERFVF